MGKIDIFELRVFLHLLPVPKCTNSSAPAGTMNVTPYGGANNFSPYFSQKETKSFNQAECWHRF